MSASDSKTVNVNGSVSPTVTNMKPPLPVTGNNVNLIVVAGALLLSGGIYLIWRKRVS